MKHYVGIDVSKSKLDIYLNRKNLSVENNSAGLSFLIEKLNEQIKQGHEIGLVLCEASGGYEKLLINTLQTAGFPVHMAHANKVRAFAKAKGLLAKTDKIDAQIISEYGLVLSPAPDIKLISASAEILGELLKRREQLLDQRQGERNRLDKERLPAVIESIKSHIKWLDEEIKRLDKQIADQQSQEDFQGQIGVIIMRTSDTYVRARIDTKTKERAAEALEAMRLSISDAIRLLMLRVADEKRLPFEVKVPNIHTRKAMAELEASKGKKFKSIDYLIEDLNKDD